MDWSKAKPEVLQQIVREGECYLDAQLRLATSADQRASVLAGIFIAAATGILLGLVALTTSHGAPVAHKYPIYLGGLIMAVMFLAAGSCCIAATIPVGFWLPGGEPKSWYRDVEQGKGLDAALGEEAEHIQSKIEDNRAAITGNARKFRWGAILGIAAPFVGAVLWVITSSSWWFGA